MSSGIASFNNNQTVKTDESELIAYVLSHDLKKPLRVLEYAYNELLNLDRNVSIDTNNGAFLDIGKAIQDLTHMINALHKYINLRIYPPVLTKVNCDEVIQTVIKELSAQILANNATIHYYQKLPIVVGNEEHLHYLFYNLIENAIKYRQEDVDPIVNISFTETINELQCIIKDNGVGIEEDFFEIIFILFQRLYTQEEIPGYGIGLAVCKRIVELWEGKITLKSKINYGSEFCLTLKKQ